MMILPYLVNFSGKRDSSGIVPEFLGLEVGYEKSLIADYLKIRLALLEEMVHNASLIGENLFQNVNQRLTRLMIFENAWDISGH